MDTKFRDRLRKTLEDHSSAISFFKSDKEIKLINSAVRELVNSIEKGGKILTAGNGGSACDAQHFSCELIGKFMYERRALPSICLCNDLVSTYAISNDYDFKIDIARKIEGIGNKGDALVAFSTSGNSRNLLIATQYAKKIGMKVILILGKDGGKLLKSRYYDVALVVKEKSTPRIQEIHEIIMHILCEEIEQYFKSCKSKIL